MQINIIKKCIEELSKDTPRLEYVRGLLEALVEMQPQIYNPAPLQTPPTVPPTFGAYPTNSTKEEEKDAGQILDDITRARIGDIKALASKGLE